MRAICFIQEVKDSDLTMRQQQLICHRALRKLQWACELELFAQAGSEAQPLSLRPGMVDLLRAAAASEVDVLMVVDVEHLHCGQACLCRYCSTASIHSGPRTANGSNPADGTG